MQSTPTFRPDPYRIFFPLGIFLGLAGVAVWPLFYFGILTGYWGISHAYLQADGFLFSFIAGFLLTAVPRFTGTENPSIRSQFVLALAVLVGSILMELQWYAIAQTAFLIAYAILLILLMRRYINRKAALPETFSLVGVAVLTGMSGTIINALAAWNLIDGGWVLAGKRSLTEGMTLLLVLGVGGFLGPRLLGFDKLPVVQLANSQSTFDKIRSMPLRTLYFIAALIIVLSIVLEYEFGIVWGSYLRAAAATFVIFATLQPWKFPAVRTTLSWCVWTATIFVVLGLWLAAILPVYRVDMLHVLFIGGFTLLILAVGMRVTLSHGGHGLKSEQKNWPLRLALTSGTIAMLARAGAPFAPQSYSEHLMFASLLWILGLGIWGWRLVRLIVAAK